MREWLVILMVLVGCTTTQPQPVAVIGRYASHLRNADIQEIERVVAAYQKEPLRKIDAVATNKVRVDVGSDKALSRFPLVKRRGRWLVDETGEFEAERSIITI
jgi:hypothetical protein